MYLYLFLLKRSLRRRLTSSPRVTVDRFPIHGTANYFVRLTDDDDDDDDDDDIRNTDTQDG